MRRGLALAALAAAPQPTWSGLAAQVAALEAVAYPHLRLEGLASGGVDVVVEPGQFSPRPQLAVTTATRQLRSRRYLLALPTAPNLPAIPGLGTVPYLTLETLLEQPVQPQSAIVLGGSAAAIALAQALARRGTETTLLSRGDRLLPTEDNDISAFVAALLEAAGVVLRLGQSLEAVQDKDGVTLTLAGGELLSAQVLLLATAGHLDLQGLNLGGVGIQPRQVHGVATALPVDDRLATAHPRVFACGPALGGYWAEATDWQDVAIAVRNALYLPWRQLARLHRPALLHTSPELARIGLTATQARRWYGSEATVLQIPFGQVIKAHCDDDITGFCRWIVRGDGQLLGAQICGPGASELMAIAALALQRSIPLQQLDRLPVLPPSLAAMLPSLSDAWQHQRWRPGTWRRDWAENWCNWRRSRQR
jgi:pyruvate/2-oxoglutarate dehydrogenase complex dihydrolipoamide dehydrogenase (E3) component